MNWEVKAKYGGFLTIFNNNFKSIFCQKFEYKLFSKNYAK